MVLWNVLLSFHSLFCCQSDSKYMEQTLRTFFLSYFLSYFLSFFLIFLRTSFSICLCPLAFACFAFFFFFFFSFFFSLKLLLFSSYFAHHFCTFLPDLWNTLPYCMNHPIWHLSSESHGINKIQTTWLQFLLTVLKLLSSISGKN